MPMLVAMTSSDIPLRGYQPIGGALCLDFANTVDWHDSERPVELLADSDSLATWARMVGEGEPDVDAADLGCAIELRDALWAAFRATTRGQPVPPAALVVLNRNLDLAPGHRRLALSGGRVEWSDRAVRGIDGLLTRIAGSAATLLTEPRRLSRVRMCEGEGCGWLFLDESRGARRRWCSMQSCGNRAKARAHYRRKALLKQA